MVVRSTTHCRQSRTTIWQVKSHHRNLATPRIQKFTLFCKKKVTIQERTNYTHTHAGTHTHRITQRKPHCLFFHLDGSETHSSTFLKKKRMQVDALLIQVLLPWISKADIKAPTSSDHLCCILPSRIFFLMKKKKKVWKKTLSLKTAVCYL